MKNTFTAIIILLLAILFFACTSSAEKHPPTDTTSTKAGEVTDSNEVSDNITPAELALKILSFKEILKKDTTFHQQTYRSVSGVSIFEKDKQSYWLTVTRSEAKCEYYLKEEGGLLGLVASVWVQKDSSEGWYFAYFDDPNRQLEEWLAIQGSLE